MLKKLILLAILVGANSCSMDNGNKENSKAGIYSLQLTGGNAFVSSDTANDEFPFLFRDTNSGLNCLFFASDRSGSSTGKFRIYYSRMMDDETFQPPVLMDANINDPLYDVFSPVLFNMNGKIFITVMKTNTVSSNIITYQLDSAYHVTNTVTNFSHFGRSLNLYQALEYLGMLICDGTSNAYSYQFTTNETWKFIETNAVFYPVNSVSGYGVVDLMGASANDYFILNTTNDQLTGMAYMAKITYTNDQIYTNSGSLTTNYFSLPDYSSSYSDITPFVDVKVGMRNLKVYFSSKRSGTYDLYRYNKVTFDSLVPSN